MSNDTIKKDYQAVMSLFAQAIELMKTNKVKKSVVEEATTLYNEATFITASKKSNGSGSNSTAYFDPETRELVAVFCYYHKRWELVSHIEYGKKAGTKTGLNTMCKEGTSAWTKANRKLQKTRDELTQRMIKGELTSDEFKVEYEAITSSIEPHSDEDHSYATLQELLDAIAAPEAE